MKFTGGCSAVLLLACVVFLAACTRKGAGTEWQALTKECLDLYHKGNYERAVEVGKQALEVAEKNVGPDHPDVAQSLNNLAALHYTQGHYAQAEPLLKRSLAIKEKALGPDHPDVASSLENMARLYRDTKREKEAEELEARAARIRSIKR